MSPTGRTTGSRTGASPVETDPVAELTAAIALGKALAAQARTDLTAATPILIDSIRHGSGQSRKIEILLQSVWNGELCDNLAGLDTKLAQAAVTIIAARAFMAGDADDLLRAIIDGNGNQPPVA